MLCIFILYVLVQRKYLHASAIDVLQAMLQCIYSIFINNNIICDRVRKEIIMLKKAARVFLGVRV